MLQKIIVRDILAEKNSQSSVSTQFGAIDNTANNNTVQSASDRPTPAIPDRCELLIGNENGGEVDSVRFAYLHAGHFRLRGIRLCAVEAVFLKALLFLPH